MHLWPLQWFTSSRLDRFHEEYLTVADSSEDPEPGRRVSWEDLEGFGWESRYLDGSKLADVPEEAGIYVVAHEYEAMALYVGQSTNLCRRVCSPGHHKISKVVRLCESAPAG